MHHGAELIEEIPDKKDRLKTILSLVEERPAAADAEEANALMVQAFEEVENALPLDEADKMHVHDLESFYDPISYEGRKIYYQFYRHHIIFIADNGAIDIRGINEGMNSETIEKDPSFPSRGLPLLFEKAGADGHGVWN